MLYVCPNRDCARFGVPVTHPELGFLSWPCRTCGTVLNRLKRAVSGG